MVELLPQILTFLDWEMAKLVENHVKAKGANVITGRKVLDPMGDLANLQGRVAGENAASENCVTFPGPIIGAQCIGPGNVNRQIAQWAMAIQGKLTVEDFVNADLPYAPPFSLAIDHGIAGCPCPAEQDEREDEGDLLQGGLGEGQKQGKALSSGRARA